MGKPVVLRDSFRGLFAFMRPAHCNGIAEDRLLRLFGSSEDIPDDLLERRSTRTGLLGSEAVGNDLSPLALEIVDGSAQDDHASDFLHRLLRELDRSVH
jgi:hypothetical protein